MPQFLRTISIGCLLVFRFATLKKHMDISEYSFYNRSSGIPIWIVALFASNLDTFQK